MALSEEQLAIVDEQFRKVKPLLVTCRQQHDVRADVVFALSYDAEGALIDVAIKQGPATMTPEFTAAAIAIVRDGVVFPSTGERGLMLLTDLGPDSHVIPADANRIAELKRKQAIATVRSNNRMVTLIVFGVVVAGIVSTVVTGRFGNSVKMPKTKRPKPIDVDVVQLAEDYRDDSSAADARYLDHLLRVSGTIESTDVDSQTAVLAAGPHGVPAEFLTPIHDDRFDNKGTVALAKLKPGEYVILHCLEVGHVPRLTQCTIE